MSAWRNGLINFYRYATWPWRWSVQSKLKQSSHVPVSILFYHRVADDYPNPWTISRGNFQQQIDWMSDQFDMVSLAETQKRIREGNERPAVAITFDDGYADNCNFALPMLIERNIPVTYFVTTYHTTHNRPFPHDMEREQPLPPNSIESIRALANAGVEIGGHTRTHIDLGSGLDGETIFDEVIAATREMESMIDSPIRYFAFPFGQRENLDPRVFDVLHENGFAGVCSAYGGINPIDGEAFHLQRMHGDPSLARIQNWLTGDPRTFHVNKYDWRAELAKTMPRPTAQSSTVELIQTKV